MNEPVLALHQAKLRSIQPPIAAEDPYIVGTLIALAQEQRRQTLPVPSADNEASSEVPTSPLLVCPDFHHLQHSSLHMTNQVHRQVRVLVIPSVTPTFPYAYRASIPPAFLDKLDRPFRFSSSPPVRISYCRLPVFQPEILVKHFPRALRLPRVVQQDVGSGIVAEQGHLCESECEDSGCLYNIYKAIMPLWPRE
jgi:hypothetical protein